MENRIDVSSYGVESEVLFHYDIEKYKVYDIMHYQTSSYDNELYVFAVYDLLDFDILDIPSTMSTYDKDRLKLISEQSFKTLSEAKQALIQIM
jgi:hypothetical protein